MTASETIVETIAETIAPEITNAEQLAIIAEKSQTIELILLYILALLLLVIAYGVCKGLYKLFNMFFS